jgi:hypothetical protein
LAAVDVDASPLVLGSGWACVKTDLGRVASLRFEPDGTSMIIYYSFAP